MLTSRSAQERLLNLLVRFVGQAMVYLLMRRLDAPRWAAYFGAVTLTHLANLVEPVSTERVEEAVDALWMRATSPRGSMPKADAR